MNAIIPVAQTPITIRPGTIDDLPFIDALQKKHHKQLGFFPRAQIEGYLKNGWMLIAQDEHGGAIGYCASRDRYQKRDELGAIFQLCVDAGAQRKLVGAMLLKSVFERSAYGTKLYCCWCAQDIEANHFWESLGFVPLAFRTGSRTKGAGGTPRVHIFWQRRIRAGDTTTPYWFPSQTTSGSIREDRLVIPIPPGTHWSDAKPVILPRGEISGEGNHKLQKTNHKQIGGPRSREKKLPVSAKAKLGFGFLSFSMPEQPKAKKEKRVKTPRVKQKNDPRHVAAARELRDRWLEEVNADPALLTSGAKYDVARARVRGGASEQDAIAPPLLQLPRAA